LRVHLSHFFISITPSLQHTGSEIVGEHIGPFHQPVHNIFGMGVVEVEGD
jgi:hypothetical protein